MENMVLDFADMDLVKNVPESINFPSLRKLWVIVKRASNYTVYNDLTGYEQFKQAITELLWWIEMQARWTSLFVATK
jgi:hypothetical protein